MNNFAYGLIEKDRESMIAFRNEVRLILQLTRNYSPADVTETKVFEQDQFLEELKQEIGMLNQFVEEEITAVLFAIGVNKVEFAEGNFDALAEYRNGSLHCMSLAVERE
jgi:ABC-type uncharacterized transport system involved in gliding motility auxiliary subunit